MKKIGVILADTQEYLPFVKFYSDMPYETLVVGSNKTTVFKGADKEIIAMHCGIGKVNAASAAAALIYRFGCDTVLNAGLSGAVSGLRREDLVAGTSYVECDFDLTAIGYDLGVKPDEESVHKADEALLEYATTLSEFHVKQGALGTGDIFLTDKEKKTLFKDTFGITAFDMESAAIAAVCSKNGVSFLSVRKISDDADDASSDDYREMNDRQEAVLAQVISGIVNKM